MLFPIGGIPAAEYDATFTIAPTSRFGHSSDTVLASVEMQIHNTGSERIEFPFMVLSTDPGTGAEAAPESVEARVLNGSQPVTLTSDEVDEVAAAEAAVQRVAAGGGDATKQEEARQFVLKALQSAERRKVGRTHIEAGAQRRLVLQQRLRVLPDPADGAFVFETIAPSPLLTTPAGGRVSVYVLMPMKDGDVRPEVLDADPRTVRDFGFTITRTPELQRDVAWWYWQNDPVLKLAYRYA